MPDVIQVVDWDELYENNRTRGMKVMQWVPVPNRHDGDGYTELVSHPNGAAHLGAWLVILQVASRCRKRGTLLRDDGTPHDEASISRRTRILKSVLEEAIPRLVSIGWLCRKPLADAGLSPACQVARSLPAGSPHPTDDGTERNGMECTEGDAPPSGTPPAREGRKSSPAEVVARALSKALGSSLNPCRKQVQALVGAGWTLDRILEVVRSHARPGMAPWDWTKAVTTIALERRGVIPDAPPKRTLEEMAAAVGMNVDQYREWHGIGRKET